MSHPKIFLIFQGPRFCILYGSRGYSGFSSSGVEASAPVVSWWLLLGLLLLPALYVILLQSWFVKIYSGIDRVNAPLSNSSNVVSNMNVADKEAVGLDTTIL